jgi:hypothetical protein
MIPKFFQNLDDAIHTSKQARRIKKKNRILEKESDTSPSKRAF